MKKLNRNNANIKKILNKKVAIVCDSKEKELDFRKWAKQYANAVNDDYVFTNCGNGICMTLEHDGLKWDYTNYFLEDNYSIYEWEIAEEKTYTIKDVVENEGKVYKIAGSRGLYKYENGKLLTNTLISSCWTTNVLNLKELFETEFVEYKEEPKKITFEEALKEMEEGNVCRCWFSNRRITVCGSHFFDDGNREFTNLSLPELQSEWIIIEG